ncbi:MAG TPA: ZIP family zinc transporter [Beijerinckiaceae bacterium]
MSGALSAGFWGLLSGSALVLGAAVAYLVAVPQRIVAAVMAFGSGVLISALSFDLMQEAFETGGFLASAAGFFGGALVYTIANIVVTRRGGHHRKRSRGKQQQASEGSGLGIAIGALLDGIPESIVIGVSLLGGQGVSVVAVAAVFLSNVPEGLSSAAGMRRAGRSPAYVFGVWGAIALASGVGAVVGYVAFADAPPAWTAAANAVAAGAILAMIVDTMIPEAFETAHEFAGLVTVTGFLCAFALTKLS